jgi:hypothetical protein
VHRSLFIFILIAGVAPAAAGQVTPLSGLRAGDTIRVWAIDPRLNGRAGIFESPLRDTLRFSSIPQPPVITTAVGFPAIRRIDVKRGTHRSAGRIVIGSVLGAAAGALVGGYLGVGLECGRTCGDEGDFEGVAGLVLGAGAGIIVGGITGGVIAGRHRTARWDAVDLRR